MTNPFGWPEPIFWPNGIELTKEQIYPPKSQQQIQSAEMIEKRKEQGRASWAVLHTMKNPTKEKLSDWLYTVPSFECSCQEFAVNYIAENPPPYGDQAAFNRWGYDFHCAVDAKTGDTPMSYEEAAAFWKW
jgi:hypothetical protein